MSLWITLIVALFYLQPHCSQPERVVQKPSKMAPKDFSCLRCKKNVGKVKAVSCATCKQWVHKECEEMSDELYSVLLGKYGGVKWDCQSCQASTARLVAHIKQVEIRLNKVEERMEAADDRSKLTKAKLDKVEMVAEQAKKAVEIAKEDITKIVLDEIRERDDKRLNIILHSVGEAGEVLPEEARRWEEDSFNNVMAAMDVKLTYRDSATFCRRLGSGGGDRARPLLIGLRKEETRPPSSATPGSYPPPTSGTSA